MNSLAPRLNIDAEIAEIRDRLSPAEKSHIDKAVVSLKAAGLQYPVGIDMDKISTVYNMALKGVSHQALAKTVAKYIRGEYSAQSFGYMPTPPELAARVREEERADRQQIIRLIERRDSQSGPEKVEKSPESKARVREKVAQFLAANSEFRRSKEKQTDAPMTPERAEMFRQIMALPDRGEPTFEVKQYRERIAKVMEDQQ